MLELSHPPRHDSGGQTNLLVYFPSCCTYCPHGQMKGNGPMDTDIIEALQSFALKMLFVAIWVFFWSNLSCIWSYWGSLWSCSVSVWNAFMSLGSCFCLRVYLLHLFDVLIGTYPHTALLILPEHWVCKMLCKFVCCTSLCHHCVSFLWCFISFVVVLSKVLCISL